MQRKREPIMPDAQIHSISDIRAQKGERIKHRLIASLRPKDKPAEPIPFVRRALKAMSGFVSDFSSAKQMRDDILMNFDSDAIEDRQSHLLDKWFEDTEGMCGIEKTKTMLEAKAGLARAIWEARK